MCTFKTLPCVPAKRPHVEHMRTFCRYTRSVLNVHTETFLNLHTEGGFRVPIRATHTQHTRHHTPLRTHNTPDTTHQTPHTRHHTPDTTHHTAHTPHTHTTHAHHTRTPHTHHTTHHTHTTHTPVVVNSTSSACRVEKRHLALHTGH